MMKKSIGTPTISLVNLNVWFGMDAHGRVKFGEYESKARRQSRFRLLCEGLKNLRPDVIAIQEANILPGYARKLADEIGYDAVWQITNSGIKFLGLGIPTNFAAGNVILAPKGHRLKSLGARRISGRGLQFQNFSFHFTELRDVIAAMVTIRNQSLIIFNTQTHFSVIWNRKWEKQLQQLVASYQLAPGQKLNLLNKIQKGQNRRDNEIFRIIAFVKKITQATPCPPDNRMPGPLF